MEAMRMEVVPRATRLNQEQLRDAEAAVEALKHGSLREAVDFWEGHHKAVETVKLTETIDRFVKSKKRSNLRERTINTLRNRLDAFASNFEEIDIDKVSKANLEDWIFREGVSVREQINTRLALSNLLGWAFGENLVHSNPVELIKPPRIDQSDPEILTIKQVRSLIDAAKSEHNGECSLYVIVSLFAGLRPSEAEALSWDDINLSSGLIRIRSSKSKKRKKRNVRLTDNAKDALSRFSHLAILPIGIRRKFNDVKHVAGFEKWPADVLRHSAISYHVEHFQNKSATALWAGNSVRVIEEHYLELVSPEDSAAFWEIIL
jgi:integrase